MADAWLTLAAQRVKNSEMPALDPRSVFCPRCQCSNDGPPFCDADHFALL